MREGFSDSSISVFAVGRGVLMVEPNLRDAVRSIDVVEGMRTQLRK